MNLVRRITVALALLLAPLASTAPPANAAAAPGEISQFPIPLGDPKGIVAGPDGNFWYVQLNGNTVGRMTPSGAVTEFPIPTANSGPRAITAGPDGNLWFTLSNPNKIGRITPSGDITEFALTTPGNARAIAAGPDGKLWFLSSNNRNVNRITTSGVVDGQFPIPAATSSPTAITAGPDGNVWFTQFTDNRIGHVTPDGVVTEFGVPTTGSGPNGISPGPDGNLWFAASSSNKIGRVTPSGVITEFPVPTANSSPNDITGGPDGNLWFTQSAQTGNKVARITPDGTITEYPLPNANSSPREITTGPDGNVWFMQNAGPRIGRVTTGISPDDRRPALSGSGQAGLPLVCGADVWGLSSTVSVAWQRNGQPITGKAGLTYTPEAGEIGSQITCTSTGRLPGVDSALTSTSNPVTVVPQASGPPGPPGPPGPAGTGGNLAAVFAPGAKTVQAGKTLRVQFGITGPASLTAQLKGKRTVTKPVQARAGTNTLRLKTPRNLKAGRYSLSLIADGTPKARTTVRVTR